MNRLLPLLSLCTLLAALVSGCAGLRDALDPRPPTASVAGVRVTGLGFDHAELLLDLRIDNPNAVAVRVAGFDYRLRTNGKTLLSGEQDRSLEIAAEDRTSLEVPLRLSFGDVAAVIGSLSGRDELQYQLDAGVDVEVPLLGRRHVVAETSGALPIPHRPRLTLESARVERLSFDGATIALALGIENPNGFALTLDAIEYRLQVEGREWAAGGSAAPLRIEPNGRGTLALSLRVDLEALGSSAYNLLARGNPVDYRLDALVSAIAALEQLGRIRTPWSSSGTIDLR